MTRVEELYEEALSLDAAELQQLVDRLTAHVSEPEIHESWLEVARERSEALAEGRTQSVPWAEVRERMYRRVSGG